MTAYIDSLASVSVSYSRGASSQSQRLGESRVDLRSVASSDSGRQHGAQLLTMGAWWMYASSSRQRSMKLATLPRVTLLHGLSLRMSPIWS
jgi:hypothetical protein